MRRDDLMRIDAPWRVRLAAACLALAAALPAWAQPRVATEAELKAAFIYRIALFVDWPPEALGAGASFQICLLGSDPGWLEAFATLEGKKVRGHSVGPTRALTRVEEARACQIMFVPEREGPRALPNAPGVLTVGEAEGFASAGGMIGFVREGAQLRFDINRDAATRAQLRLPAELLKVARKVVDGGGAKP